MKKKNELFNDENTYLSEDEEFVKDLEDLDEDELYVRETSGFLNTDDEETIEEDDIFDEYSEDDEDDEF